MNESTTKARHCPLAVSTRSVILNHILLQYKVQFITILRKLERSFVYFLRTQTETQTQTQVMEAVMALRYLLPFLLLSAVSAEVEYDDRRCICFCPNPSVVNGTAGNGTTSNRLVYREPVPPSSCNCDSMVLPRVADMIRGHEQEFCPRCECKYESRNSTTIKATLTNLQHPHLACLVIDPTAQVYLNASRPRPDTPRAHLRQHLHLLQPISGARDGPRLLSLATAHHKPRRSHPRRDHPPCSPLSALSTSPQHLCFV
ncbi:Transmembrane protein 9B [Portunus trituberculatus]|uniref:Transmembrane protein 9B n=1 Tax=Portunus trituberculatus TaxID=210409 RepID=A0A5B7ERH5_PORTR|nr:Transmembrane protein 9B [Portunus trituberculatus]